MQVAVTGRIVQGLNLMGWSFCFGFGSVDVLVELCIYILFLISKFLLVQLVRRNYDICT